MKRFLKSLLATAGLELRRIRHTPQVKSEGAVVEWPYKDHLVRFYLESRYDLIGRDLFNGRFFEIAELEELARRVDPSGTVVDVGANIGNHTVFFGVVMGAQRVLSFEPGAWAHSQAAFNIALNGLSDRVVLHKLALSDHDGTGRMTFWAKGNHGTLWLSDDPDGEEVKVVRGDPLMPESRVTLIKIDVERHEHEVIEGLKGTIARDRPVICVETAQIERPGLEKRMAALGYQTVFTKERYGDIVNLIFEPDG